VSPLVSPRIRFAPAPPLLSPRRLSLSPPRRLAASSARALLPFGEPLVTSPFASPLVAPARRRADLVPFAPRHDPPRSPSARPPFALCLPPPPCSARRLSSAPLPVPSLSLLYSRPPPSSPLRCAAMISAGLSYLLCGNDQWRKAPRLIIPHEGGV